MQLIEINPDVCNGRAVIRGTRITVSTILGFLSAGDSVESILEGYPQLKREDVLACLEYAQTMMNTHSAIRLTA